MLTDDDLHGADAATKRFLRGLHEDALGSDDTTGEHVALNAGLQYLNGRNVADAYMHTRFRGVDADRALDYGKDVQNAVNAVGAPSGSIAAREDPYRYGSVASREFKGTFQPGATDQLNDFAGDSDQNRGLAKRSLFQSLTGGG